MGKEKVTCTAVEVVLRERWRGEEGGMGRGNVRSGWGSVAEGEEEKEEGGPILSGWRRKTRGERDGV